MRTQSLNGGHDRAAGRSATGAGNVEAGDIAKDATLQYACCEKKLRSAVFLTIGATRGRRLQ